MAFQLFPSFSFDESNVGPRPIRTATLDRIGFVGVFSRGPLTPRIVDARQAETIYGFDENVGSAHLQAAIDQGASDFIVSPVFALGAAPTATVTAGGTVTSTGTLTVTLKKDAGSQTVSVAVTAGQTAAQVSAAVADAVAAADPIHEITASNSGTADVLFKGRNNNDNYVLKVRYSAVAGMTFVSGAVNVVTTDLTLAGGIDDPTAAQSILKDSANVNTIELEVIWPGSSGNDVMVYPVEGFEPNTFDLQIELANPAGGQPLLREVYRGIDMTDIYDSDKLSALRGSNIVRARKLSTGVVPKTVSLGQAFSTGTNGDPAGASFADYAAALQKLEDLQCTILVCPGEKAGLTAADQKALNEILITMAEKSDDEMGELLGLRIAVVSAPRGTTANDLVGLKASGYIPNSKRTVMTLGWGTSARLKKFKRFGIDPAAVYAGHLMTTPASISPAARSSSPFIRGITEVDTPTGNPALNEITKYRCDAIILDPVTGGLHMLNGRTTSSDPAWYWICIRRVYDKIRMDIFFNMQFMKSEPSSKAMDDVVQDSITSYLNSQMKGKLIAGYNPAISNDSNNKPETRSMGIRYVDFAIEPYFPNDFTQFNISRVLRAQIRLA